MFKTNNIYFLRLNQSLETVVVISSPLAKIIELEELFWFISFEIQLTFETALCLFGLKFYTWAFGVSLVVYSPSKYGQLR